MKVMNINRVWGVLLGCVLGGFVLVVPVSAQGTEAEYRATLITLITVLQEQVALLQAQVAPAQLPNTSGLLGDIEGTLVASYTVSDGAISTRAPRAYRDYLERLLTILPDQYDDHVDELVVFADGDQNIGAYVETVIPYTQDWRYAIRDTEIAEDPDSAASTELMIHEFAHIFSLDQVFRGQVSSAGCHPYFADTLCYGSDTYLGQFIATFWSTRMLDQLQAIKTGSRLTPAGFYDRYESQFVSEYASTDPAEDFAESFAWYVYGEIAPRGSVADEKIAFFDQFAYIRALADAIREEI